MGILDQIAQPQMADIVGALDIRQKRLDADEAKRKEIRMGQLIAEAIPNLKPGSTLERMAKDDPKNFMLVTKAFGIPLNAGDQAQQLADDIDTLYQAAQTDPKDAYDRAIQLKAERNAKGLETPQIDKFLEGMEDDPQRTMTGLFVSHRSLNQEEYDKREMMKRKMDQEDRSLDIQEKRITADRSASVNKRFGAQETLKDEAGNLFFATSKMDPSTGDMVGVVAAVDGSDTKPQGSLRMTGGYGLTAGEKVNQAGAQTEATEKAKDRVEALQALPSIESNAQFVTDNVKALLDHPGREMATGASSIIPTIAGTDQAGFVSRFDQLSGDAFLQAFASLKGGGAISEIEGEKAQKAINRMTRNTKPEEFEAAAKDFLEIVEAGVRNKRKQAGKEVEDPKKAETANGKVFSGQDKQAYDWAKSNPGDPRSAQILQRLGVK